MKVAHTQILFHSSDEYRLCENEIQAESLLLSFAFRLRKQCSVVQFWLLATLAVTLAALDVTTEHQKINFDQMVNGFNGLANVVPARFQMQTHQLFLYPMHQLLVWLHQLQDQVTVVGEYAQLACPVPAQVVFQIMFDWRLAYDLLLIAENYGFGEVVRHRQPFQCQLVYLHFDLLFVRPLFVLAQLRNQPSLYLCKWQMGVELDQNFALFRFPLMQQVVVLQLAQILASKEAAESVFANFFITFINSGIFTKLKPALILFLAPQLYSVDKRIKFGPKQLHISIVNCNCISSAFAAYTLHQFLKCRLQGGFVVQEAVIVFLAQQLSYNQLLFERLPFSLQRAVLFYQLQDFLENCFELAAEMQDRECLDILRNPSIKYMVLQILLQVLDA